MPLALGDFMPFASLLNGQNIWPQGVGILSILVTTCTCLPYPYFGPGGIGWGFRLTDTLYHDNMLSG